MQSISLKNLKMLSVNMQRKQISDRIIEELNKVVSIVQLLIKLKVV